MALVIWTNLTIRIYSPPFQKNKLLLLELKEIFSDISSAQSKDYTELQALVYLHGLFLFSFFSW